MIHDEWDGIYSGKTYEAVKQALGIRSPSEDYQNFWRGAKFPMTMFDFKSPVCVYVEGELFAVESGTMECTTRTFNALECSTTLSPANYVGSAIITPQIKDVIFNPPATIVFRQDGTKTVVQARDGDIYDPEKGLAMAISKKILGNKHDYYHTFLKYMKKKQED